MPRQSMTIPTQRPGSALPEGVGGERSEPTTTGGRAEPGRPPSQGPDPEVSAALRRRRFTADYKLRILREVEACRASGEIGALLRREGLYSSLLTEWRRARDQGALEVLQSKRRGPRPRLDDRAEQEIAQLRRENERLQGRLRQAEIIIDVQKKISELLGISLPASNERSS